MTKFQTALFDPAEIKTRKTEEVLQGKIPAAALEEMFPIDVKLETPKPEPEAFKEVASPIADAGVYHWEEKPVPESPAAPPDASPEKVNTASGEIPAAPPMKADIWKELFEKAANLYRDDIDGNREAIRECHKILDRILETAADSLAEAYYGSDTAKACGCGKNPVYVENVPAIAGGEKEEKEIGQEDKDLQQAAVTRGSISAGSGEPPICAVPGDIQSAIIGVPFGVDLVASDPGGLITGIEGVDLPQWAALNIITKLPSPDAVARISGTPGPENKGLHVMRIAATNDAGEQSVSPLKIKVGDYGFTDEKPGLS